MADETVAHARTAVTRKIAKSQGLRYYSTGKPCKRGHNSPRLVSAGTCVECQAEQNKRHYWANRESCLASNKLWKANAEERAASPKPLSARARAIAEGAAFYFTGRPCKRGHIAKRLLPSNSCSECFRLYYQENREYLLAYAVRNASAWRANNREAHRESVRLWTAANPEKAKANALTGGRNRRARDLNAEGHHTREDIARIGNAQKWRCAWCGAPARKKYHVDHVLALSKGGTNWPNNLVISCGPCNLRKHAKDPIQWAQEIGRLL